MFENYGKLPEDKSVGSSGSPQEEWNYVNSHGMTYAMLQGFLFVSCVFSAGREETVKTYVEMQ